MLNAGFGIPHIGGALHFMRDKLGYLSSAAERHGDVAVLGLGRPTYLLTNPDDVRRVLVSHSSGYARTPRISGNKARNFFGDGVVTMTGTEHLKQRRALQPAFHQSAIDRLAAVITETAVDHIGTWSAQDPIDVHKAVLAMLREINLRVLFGKDATTLRDAFHTATTLRRSRQEYLLGKPSKFFRSRVRGYERARSDLDARVLNLVAIRRANANDSDDILGMLAAARHDDGTAMSDTLIADELRTLSVAGYETVAEAITWTLVLLSQHREIETAVRDEAANVTGLASATAMRELVFTRMVMSEAMRLYPPSWLIVRVAVDDNEALDGTRIPRGSRIYISPWVIHRMAKYHPDPERFDPMRFTSDAIASRPRLTYLPFGAGARQCIGENLAWLEGILVLAAIHRMVKLTRAAKDPVIPEPNVTLRPSRPVLMRVTRA